VPGCQSMQASPTSCLLATIFNWDADYHMAVSAHHIVNAALQLCAARAQAGAALPLRLERLAAQWHLMYPSILEPLSVCTSLIALDLDVMLWPGQAPLLYTALGRQQGLQELKLRIKEDLPYLQGEFTGAISHLAHLRRLELGGWSWVTSSSNQLQGPCQQACRPSP
jgi:hypothetical protein